MSTFSRRAEWRWDGELMTGSGEVTAGSGAFKVSCSLFKCGRGSTGQDHARRAFGRLTCDLLRHRSAFAHPAKRWPCEASYG